MFNHRNISITNTLFYLFIALSLGIRVSGIGFSDLLVEEAYYWNYSMHLDWSYLDHPPLVAVLIKISTFFWGINEWGVRFPALMCWFITVFFSYRLTRMVTPEAKYSIFFLSLLPFFFLQSMVMTPDQPLLAAWSAASYFAYRACILHQSNDWYALGIALGIGMLAKYTIILLGVALFLYLLIEPSARYWLKRKEPYLALILIVILFFPVIYWNAHHSWASFAFQSTRRLQEHYSFSTHYLLGLIILFLMPWGVASLIALYQKNSLSSSLRLFFQLCTGVPIAVFVLFSFTHPVKFNWIGPALLALIPWLSIRFHLFKKYWYILGVILLLGYSSMLFTIVTGQPKTMHRLLLSKYQNWQMLTQEWLNRVENIELQLTSTPVIISLDKYNIASELLFYQAKLLPQSNYMMYGSHIFGGESLMYRFWDQSKSLAGKYVVLVSDNILHFNNPAIAERTVQHSKIQSFQAYSQGNTYPIKTYYYQLVQMKN